MRRLTGYLIIILIMFLAILPIIFSGCQKVTFIPGASYGYYIWEDDGKIHISWSIDKKDASFSGSISTDGKIGEVEFVSWEDSDISKVTEDTLSYTSTLGPDDYTDGIIIEITGYTYVELDPRINDGHDLSRVHLGTFLNNPDNSPFRISPEYFKEVRSIPWYEKNPFSGFFGKLFNNIYFTFAFLFVIGVAIIEIIRITAFSGKKLRKLYTGIAYLILICLEVAVYFLLRFFVL
jgi:hypothetical protein